MSPVSSRCRVPSRSVVSVTGTLKAAFWQSSGAVGSIRTTSGNVTVWTAEPAASVRGWARVTVVWTGTTLPVAQPPVIGPYCTVVIVTA